MEINKRKLTEMISERGDFNLGDSELFVNIFVGILEDAVKNKWNFSVRGLGKLLFTRLPARETADPKTPKGEKGKRVWFPESYRIKFKLAKNIRNKIKED